MGGSSTATGGAPADGKETARGSTEENGGTAGATCFTPDGTGGDAYLYRCPEWLNAGLANATCNAGAGGEGGAGTRPALARLRERRGGIDGKTRDLILCPDPLRESLCVPDHEAQVRACLDGGLPPCSFTSEVCTAIVQACPGVTLGDCYYGLEWTFFDPATLDTPCYEELAAHPGAECRERFLECAWWL